MTWGEFSSLLSGLLPDTPLGEIVSIRSETDRERISRFTPAQRRIYDAWKNRGMTMQTNEAYYQETMRQIERLFLTMGGA